MSVSTDGEALELIRYNVDTGKFQCGERALAILRDIHTPLSVVAVCGRARQGKSFILNQLLQVTGGFQIGSTTRPCTKGLWMWSTPQWRVDEEGNEYHIVLLDTEGIDAYDQTAQYSTQIFSLAVLLSSLFVYNQMGGIDEAALDRLSLVTEMTKHIKVRANSKTGTDKELREFTPSFLWLLRDFYLRLEDEYGRKVSPNDYLETALMPVAGVGPAVEAKNAIRTSIKSLFPDRDCATLVRPMHDEQALVNLDHTTPDDLRPEFKEGVAALIQLIFSKAQPKHYGSFVLQGPVLAGLTEAYVKAINDGAVPTIATAWQGVAEQECRRAADVAEAAYAAAFNEHVAPEEPSLDEEHERCLGMAQAAFAQVAVGDDRVRKIHESKYIDACTARFAQVRARKLAEAAGFVNELLLKATSLVSTALAAEGAEAEGVQALLTKFLDEYVRMAAGPQKWVKLVDFLKTTYPLIINDLTAKKDAQARAEVARLTEELSLAQKQISSLHDKADRAGADVAEAVHVISELKRRLREQAHQMAAYKVDAQDKKGKVSALEAQIRELQLVSEKKLMSVTQEAEAAARLERLTFQQEITSWQCKFSEQQSHSSELATEVAELEGRVATLEAQQAAASDETAHYIDKYGSAKSETAQLAHQVEEAHVQIAALLVQKQLAEKGRQEAEATVSELQAQLEDIGAEIASHMQEAEAEQRRTQSQTGFASFCSASFSSAPSSTITGRKDSSSLLTSFDDQEEGGYIKAA